MSKGIDTKQGVSNTWFTFGLSHS